MKVKFWGTRGSISVANPQSVRYGGNTTCLQISSPCLPRGTLLAVDAGSGYVPMARQALKEGINHIFQLQTHYHHDHTGGLLLAPVTFIKRLLITIWGPLDRDRGPQEIFKSLMQRPFFPVDWANVASHFQFRKIDVPSAYVVLIHPEGGFRLLKVDEFERLEKENALLPFGKKNGAYPRIECMVVRMIYTNHPDLTVSYRFEEGPTGKVFVFLTDHENTDGFSAALEHHVSGADLLVEDCQYSREQYEASCVSFGHGTPDYCVALAIRTGVKRLGLTHHDPTSTDERVDKIVEEARNAFAELMQRRTGQATPALTQEAIFACADYEEVDV